MIVAFLIVQHSLLLYGLLSCLLCDIDQASLFRRKMLGRSLHSKLQRIEKASCISSSHIYKMLQGPTLKLHPVFSIASFLICYGLEGYGLKVFICKLLKLEDPGPGYKSLVHFKVWILCSGTNKDEGSILNPGKQGILLAFVPPVDFIYKQYGPHPPMVPPILGLRYFIPKLLHT